MTNLERNAIAVVGLGSVLWAGGLFAAYVLRETPPPPPPKPPVPAVTATGAPTVAVAPPTVVTLAGPPVVTTVADLGLPTLAEKRAHLAEPPADASTVSASNPHGRWETRTGVELPPPPSLPATAVTVHLKGVSTRAALAEVGKAAGAKLVVFPSYAWRQTPFPAAITLDADHRPMMEVVNELCAKTGLACGSRTTSNEQGSPASADPAVGVLGLQPQDADGGPGPWVVSGPFAFEAQRVVHDSPIGAGAASAVSVLMSVAHEPRIVVLGEPWQVAATEATDEAGHSLLPPAPEAPASGAGSILGRIFGSHTVRRSTALVGQGWWGQSKGLLTIPLTCPPDAGRRITRLRLVPRFLIQEKSERIEVDVGAGHTADTVRTAAGLTVTVGPVTGLQQSNCTVTFARGKQGDDDWEQLHAALRNVVPVLVDARGRALPVPQANPQSDVGSSVQLQFYWYQQEYYGGNTILKPAKLILDVPSALRSVDVPIEIHDLPLP